MGLLATVRPKWDRMGACFERRRHGRDGEEGDVVMRSRVCELLGVEFPILAFSHCRDVVAAVTNAGGLGVLGAVAHTPDQLEIDLAWIDERVKGRSYGVDLLLPRTYTEPEVMDLEDVRENDAESASDHKTEPSIPDKYKDFVQEMLLRYGVPELSPDQKASKRRSPGLSNVSPRGYQPLLDVAFAHPVRLIASALGSPPEWLTERAHSSGMAVAALAGARRHAEAHRDAGVDLIVAQGSEAGGHTGDVSTMVLVPEVVDAVAPTPVLAAGGIATGRQMAAAMALGAEGVWCGSVWLTTEEAETHPAVKQKFLAAESSDTVRSRSLTGKPARMLRSAWTEEWDRPDAPPPLPLPLQSALVANAQRRIARMATKDAGAYSLINYFVGQVVGRLDRVKPARTVVLDMMTEYADVMSRFALELEELQS